MAKKRNTRRVRRAPRIAPTRERAVGRQGINRLIERLNERAEIINELQRNQQIQFHRLAQLQAELDVIKRGWEKIRARQ
jgi:hypothetical protein